MGIGSTELMFLKKPTGFGLMDGDPGLRVHDS